jgi:hypothetical protein
MVGSFCNCPDNSNLSFGGITMSWFTMFAGAVFVAMLLTVMAGDPGSWATIAKVGIMFVILLGAAGFRLFQVMGGDKCSHDQK